MTIRRRQVHGLQGRGTIANKRIIRGSPIGRFQMIQAQIAEGAIAVEDRGGLVYKTARFMEAGLPNNRIAAIARYHAAQTAKFCTDTAQQIFDSYGLSTESRIHCYKNYADLASTGEGSASIQHILIAEDALGYKEADRRHGKTGLRHLGKSE